MMRLAVGILAAILIGFGALYLLVPAVSDSAWAVPALAILTAATVGTGIAWLVTGEKRAPLPPAPLPPAPTAPSLPATPSVPTNVAPPPQFIQQPPPQFVQQPPPQFVQPPIVQQPIVQPPVVQQPQQPVVQQPAQPPVFQPPTQPQSPVFQRQPGQPMTMEQFQQWLNDQNVVMPSERPQMPPAAPTRPPVQTQQPVRPQPSAPSARPPTVRPAPTAPTTPVAPTSLPAAPARPPPAAPAAPAAPVTRPAPVTPAVITPADSGDITETGSNLTPSEAAKMLEAHNKRRAKYGTPPLTWDPKIAQSAQAWSDEQARRGTMEHETQQRYGENLYWTLGRAATPEDVLVGWSDQEAKFYNVNSHQCEGGVCGHHVQVLDKRSSRLGCGKTTKPGRSGRNEEFITCRYLNPGNMELGSVSVPGTGRDKRGDPKYRAY